MPYSAVAFAASLPPIRPDLVHLVRHVHRCGLEDAEDLVAEAVTLALVHLAEYRPETGSSGLRRWLIGFLYRVLQRERRSEMQRIETVSLTETVEIPIDTEVRGNATVDETILMLPPRLRSLVRDWLSGYGQRDIARRHRLHRNTVALHLEEAFTILRTAVPDANAMTYSSSLFTYCSRVTVYRKPTGVWRPWSEQHPPEPRYRRPATPPPAAPEERPLARVILHSIA